MNAKRKCRLRERNEGAQGGKGTSKNRKRQAIGPVSKEARWPVTAERCVFVSVRRHWVVDHRCALELAVTKMACA